MRHSTRLSLGIARRGHRRRARARRLLGIRARQRRATRRAPAQLTPVKLQLQWVAQAQFAGYYAALAQGYYKDEGLDVDIVEGGHRHRADRRAGRRRRRLRDLLGAEGARLDRAGRQRHRRRADLRAQRHDADLLQGQEHHLARPTSRARTSAAGATATSGSCSPACRRPAWTPPADITLVQQAFDMNGFLAGDIDAAQAMTYNEYAQVLETENPTTGQLYQPDDLNVINWNDEGTAMLQDAIWARRGQARRRHGLPGHHRRSSSRPRSRAGSTPGTTPRRPREIVDGRRVHARHEPPAVDDQRGQQADLALDERHRHDRQDGVGPDGRRSPWTPRTTPGATDHHDGSAEDRATRTTTSRRRSTS